MRMTNRRQRRDVPNVMLGYARLPAETRRSFTPERFFLTGDLGIIDEDGYVRIVGRRRETILRGGFQIYPREVDDQLRAHPAVDDVCVIGVPQDILGELVCARIVPFPISSASSTRSRSPGAAR